MPLKEILMPEGFKDIDELVRSGNAVPAPVPVMLREVEASWAEMIPLTDDLLPVEKFDLDLLPGGLRGWAADTSQRMDVMPVDFFAVGIVVALGSLIGRRVSIHPKQHDSWTVTPNLWGGGIGRPSTKKSPAFKEAMKFSRSLEAEAHDAYELAVADYEASQEADKLHRKGMETELKKVAKTDKVRAKSMLLSLQDEDAEAPARKRYTVADATIEKLGELLKENPNGLLMFRDELTGWLYSLDKDGREQDRAFYLEAWNGNGDFAWDRIGRGTVYIPSVVVSVLGGIQPSKLLPYLRSMKDGAGDDGLLQRFQLLVWPDVDPPRHVDRAPDERATQAVRRLFQAIDAMPQGEVVRFSPEAQDTFDRWYASMLEKESRETSPHIESHLVKFHSLMPSLALIFQVVEDQGLPESVGADAVARARAWCRYLETHARRIYALVDDPLAGARHLAGRLQKLPNSFKVKDVSEKGWTSLSTTEDVKAALSELVNRNYVREVSSTTGGRPSVSYFINPIAVAMSAREHK